MAGEDKITSVLNEDREFPPPHDFSSRIGGAYLSSMDEYEELHRRSLEDPEGFWGEVAQELHWYKPWDKVLEWNLPDAKWFVGGQTNICFNCVDRQVEQGHGDAPAIMWEAEPLDGGGNPIVKTYSYKDLQAETAKLGNALKSLGVARGDVVTIYMGMVPELAIAILACARIGAAHSVIFGGFAPHAISDRMEDAESSIVLTCDGAWRRGKVVPLKRNVDEAARLTDRIKTVLVLQRTGEDAETVDGSRNSVTLTEGRDHWWHEVVASQSTDCPCEPMDSEDMLFLLYTSGSTGKPKGILHTTGGYMVWTYLTSKYTFNLKADQDHVYWCTADIGWITGHSYIVYGILPHRVPSLMYEGAPNFPRPDRFWDIVERHKVTQFYTAPTAIRAFMKWGDEHVKQHDLTSLKLLGTVGEPINPKAWMWYRETIGGGKCPIVDTWWQTETGGHMLTPLPGVTPTVPGSCCRPMIGIDAAIVDEQGAELPQGSGGLLGIKKPWPGMLRGIYGNRERFVAAYWSRLPGMYFPGDGARQDEKGNFWIMGRVDDVINVSGHRLGTMEVESALVSHQTVVEAAVVGMPHEIKGTGIAAFVTLAPGSEPGEALRKQLTAHVGQEIGAIAKPDQIRFTDHLPKTRSGKIMRRLLRDVAANREIQGDVTTLEDFGALEKLQKYQQEG